MLSKLKNKKYETLILIIVLIIGILLVNNISHVDKFKGKVKIENATVNLIGANINEVSSSNKTIIKSSDILRYEIEYNLDKKEETNNRNVIVKATLNDEESKYAEFRKIKQENITSEVSEDKKEITVTIKNVEQEKKQKLKLELYVRNAPNGFKVNPKIEIKEQTEENYKRISTEEAIVNTTSIKGTVRQFNGKTKLPNIELKLVKDNKEIKRTYTNEDGTYAFTDIENGIYKVEAAEEKYEIVSTKEVILENEATLDLILKEVKPYELSVKKYITKLNIINDGEQKEYSYDEIDRVNQSIKKLKNLSGEITYKVKIKNIGKKQGIVTLVKENIPEGLSFDKEKNKGWKEKNGNIYNESLEGITLKAGEEKELSLVLNITETNEAKSYLNKVKVMGEVYEKIVYILDNKIYKEEEVLEGEKIQEPEISESEYEFSGWYTDKNYTNKYNFKNEVTKDIILYGKHIRDDIKYKVTFVDGLNGKVLSSKEYEEGSIVEEPELEDKEGYTFEGWYEKNEDGSYKDEKETTPITVSGNITLYSKYNINKYKVEFYSYEDKLLSEEKVEYNNKIKNVPNVEREYYTFEGWHEKDEKGNLKEEKFDVTKEIKEDIKLYPKYNRIKYQVRFFDEGTLLNKKTKYDAGTKITIPEDPKKDGYTFKGWYEKDENGNYSEKLYTFKNDLVTENVDLYSKYEINKYKVEFYSYEDKLLSKEEVEYNNKIKNVPNVEREYYTFEGWHEKDENGNLKDDIFDVNQLIKSNVKLYPKYNRIKYQVRFFDEGTLLNRKTEYDAGTKLDIPNDPSKEGYTFTGWFEKDENGILKEFPYTFESDIVTGNLDLYSKYEINKYKVEFYSYEDKLLSEEKVEYNNKIKNVPNVEREYYTFEGWHEKDENGNLKDDIFDVNQLIKSNVKLYPKYNIIKYQVRFFDEENLLNENKTEYDAGSIIVMPEDPSKAGYTFKGWYEKNIDGSLKENPYVFENDIVTENVDLYSKYEINKYTVTYYDINPNVDPLMQVPEKIGEEIVNYNDVVKQSDQMKQNVSEKLGYRLVGWKNQDETSFDINTKITKNINLYTVYTMVENGVTFDDEGRITTKTVQEGKTVEKINDKGKEGYTFEYWSLSKEDPSEFDFNTPIMGTITLYAIYSRNSYTLTIDPVGGTYTGTNPDTVAFNDTREITDPVKEGYTFTGWTVTETGSSKTLDGVLSGKTLTMPAKNVTLTANYTVNKYTLTIDPVGGTYTGTNPDTVSFGDVRIIENPIKEGYTFTGWTITDTDTQVSIPDVLVGKTLTMPAKNVTLTANYTVNEYTLTIDPKGGTYTGTNPDTVSFNDTREITDPVKEGYTFTGWTVTETGTSKELNNALSGRTLTMPAKNVTLTANYTVNKYTLTIDAKGGTYTGTNPDTVSFNDTREITDPVKEGYTFTGWTVTDTDTQVSIPDVLVGKTLTMPAKNVTLTANYTVNKYTLTIDAKGGTYTGTNPDTVSFNDTRVIVDPIKEGYTFTGWTVTDTDTKKTISGILNEKILTMPAKNVTLTANYTVNEYTLTIDPVGGTYTGTNPDTVSFNDTREITDPVKEGYTFTGWTVTDTDTQVSIPDVLAGKTLTMPAKNVTLTANYTVNEYTLTIDARGGTYTGTNPDTVAFNDTREITDPVKEGYTFTSWTVTETNTTNLVDNILVGNTLTMPAKNVTLTANYTANKYTVRFIDGENIMDTKQVEYGQTVEKIEDPTKEHNIFIGWTLNDEIYDFNSLITGNIDLYSSYELVEKPIISHIPTEWTKDSVTVTINSNHEEYSYKYKIGEGDYQDYTVPFTVSENTTVVAKSLKNGVESETESHEISNIDKVKPIITDFTENNITPESFDIRVRAKDNESGISEIKIYKDDELLVTYPYSSNLNEEKEETYSITGLEEETKYKIKVEAIDKVGNISEVNEKEVKTAKKIIIARIIGRNNSLYENEEEYERFESLSSAISACKQKQCTIQMVLDTEENIEVLNGQNITLDINGKVITSNVGTTIINNGMLYITDNSSEIGTISNTVNTAIRNTNEGVLQLGENEEPLSVSKEKPSIQGSTYGIENEGIFKFFDGKVKGSTAVSGEVSETPYLYSAKISQEGDAEVATLRILAEAEARINKSAYYTKIKEAVSDTKSGTYEYEDVSEELMKLIQTKSMYGFKYNEEDNTLSPASPSNSNIAANSYIRLDLRDYDVDQQIYVNVEGGYNQKGYVSITQSKDMPSSSNFLEVGNGTNENTMTLEKGKVYYLHFVATNNYKYIVKSIKMRNKVSFELTNDNFVKDSSGTGGFIYDENSGSITNSTTAESNKVASSYIKVDMTNEINDKKLQFDISANLNSNYDNSRAFIYVTNSETVPVINDSTGRQYFFNSSVNGTYDVTLQAGQINYIHLLFYKVSDNNRYFKINSITELGEYVSKYTGKKEIPVLNTDVDTVQLLKNITLTEPLEISETKDMILDLNGNTLTTSSTDYVIKNNGSLTIKDSKYDETQAQYDTEYEQEIAKNEAEYEQELEQYNKDKEANKTYENNIEITKSNFTSSNRTYTFSGGLGIYNGSLNSLGVTYYNEKITVADTKVSAKLKVNLYHSIPANFLTNGKVYIGFSKTNEASKDDFDSFIQRDINKPSNGQYSIDDAEEINVSISEPGEYYFKIVIENTSDANGTSIYSDLYSLKFGYLEPTKKEATKKEASLSSITSTTGSTILNNRNAKLNVESAIINSSTENVNTIDNLGYVNLSKTSIINVNGTDSKGIYNIGDGTINTNNNTINVNGKFGAALYFDNGENKLIKNIELNNLNINLSTGNSYSYGVYNNSINTITLNNSNIITKSGYGYVLYNNLGGEITASGDATKLIGFSNNSDCGTIYNSSGTINLNLSKELSTVSGGYYIFTNKDKMNINGVAISDNFISLLNANTSSVTNIDNSEFTSNYSNSYLVSIIKATINISNSKIKDPNSYAVISSSDKSIVNLKNSEVTGKTGIVSKGGEINIESSKVIGAKEYAIYNNVYGNVDLNLTIGTNDDDVSTTLPYIEGVKGGISSKTNINFYDGKIVGTNNTNAIGSSINEIPNNYLVKVDKVDDREEMYLVKGESVAKIGSTIYNSLNDAFDAVSDNSETTIELLKDVNMVNKLSISDSKNIILDLKGHNIKSYVDENFISNNGTFVVTDSSDEKGSISGYTLNLINNNGIAKVMNGATIKNLKNDEASDVILNNNKFTLDNSKIVDNSSHNSSNGIKNNGEFIIENNTKTENVTFINSENATLNLIDGELTSTNTDVIQNSGNFKMEGGTIKNSTGSGIINNKTGNLNITGGNISGSSKSIFNHGNGTIENVIIGAEIDQFYNDKPNNAIYNGIVSDDGNLTLKNNNVNAYYNAISVKETAIVTVIGGNYVHLGNTNYSAISVDKGQLNIENNSNITSNSDGILVSNNNSQILNIKSANIKTTSDNNYAVKTSSSNAIITIGENDDAVNNSLVTITGGKNGLYNASTSTINYYDGVIKGYSEAISGTITDTPVGYEIIKENYEENGVVREKAYLDRLPVAQIGETKYYSLQDAIDAVGAEETEIDLVRKITILSTADPVVIPEGKKINLDLNGYVIDANNKDSITNNGTLTITDSKAIDECNSYIQSATTNMILNNGTLNILRTKLVTLGNISTIINNGNINITGKVEIANTSTTANSNVNIIINNSNATLTVENSKISMSNKAYSTIISNKENAVVNIKNSTITAMNGRAINNYGTLTINNKTKIDAYDTTSLYNNATGEMTIEDSTIGGAITNFGTGNISSSTLNIVRGLTNSSGEMTLKNDTVSGYSNIVKVAKDSTVNVIGGTYSSSNYYYQGFATNVSGTLNVEGATITSTGSYGVQLIDSGILNFKSGKLSMSGGAAITTKGTNIVTIGVQDGTADKDLLTIETTNNSNAVINNGKSTINFYDGTLKSKGTVVSGKIDNIEANYVIYDETISSVNHKYLKQVPVAELTSNNKSYYSLKEAIEDSSNTDTINLLENITIISSEEEISLPEEKNITIDLKGHTINAGNTNTITNNGTLTLTDSNNSGSIINETGTLLTNNGTLESNININGKIENSGTYTVNGGTISNSITNTETGIMNVKSGSLNYVITNNNELNIINGNVVNVINNGITNLKDGTLSNITNNKNLNVTGGFVNHINNYSNVEFKDYTYSSSVATTIEINSIKGTTEFNNCTFGENVKVMTYSNSTGTITINGGSYSNLTLNQISNLTIKDAIINSGYMYSTSNTNISGSTINATYLKMNTGTKSITNSNITVSQNVIVSGSGNTTIENSNITSTATNTYPALEVGTRANVSIIGDSTITGYIGIRTDNNSLSTLTIGEDDKIINEKPLIIGTETGVLNGSGNTFNYYDGTIKAATPISGTVNPAGGYKVDTTTDETGVNVSTLKVIGEEDRVASVNGLNFPSLESAINSVPTTGVLTNVILYSSVSLSNNITIKDGQNIKLYLNGRTLAKNSYDFVKEGTGTIEIVDGSAPTSVLGNIINSVKKVLNISQVSKDIVLYEMSDGSKLSADKTYNLYKEDSDGEYKLLTMNEEEQIGRYTIGNETKDMNVVRGRLYLNDLSEGNYKIIDNDGKELLFNVTSEGKVYGHVREGVVGITVSVIATATSELIFSIQTGVASSGLLILFILLSIIGLLLLLVKKQNKYLKS